MKPTMFETYKGSEQTKTAYHRTVFQMKCLFGFGLVEQFNVYQNVKYY